MSVSRYVTKHSLSPPDSNAMNQPYLVTYSTVSPQSLTEHILPLYDIGAIEECTFLYRGMNDTYHVVTAINEYVLRVYRFGWRTMADIEFELDLLCHLEKQHAPISAPVIAKDRKRLHWINAPEGNRAVVLFSFAPGIPLNYEDRGPEQALIYGRAMARLHNSMTPFQSVHQRYELDIDHLLDRPMAVIISNLRHRPEDLEYLKLLSNMLRQQLKSLPPNSLKSGVCHGDLHGGNAHITEDGQLTFFDFDCCGNGWHVYDLATFQWGARAREKLEDLWLPFLQGYREFRLIDEQEIALIPSFVAVRQIWLLGLHIERTSVTGRGWADEHFLDRMIKPLQQLTSQ